MSPRCSFWSWEDSPLYGVAASCWLHFLRDLPQTSQGVKLEAGVCEEAFVLASYVGIALIEKLGWKGPLEAS